MLNRLGGAAVAAVLIINAAAPAHAQFGKLGKALRTINKVATGGTVTARSPSDPEDTDFEETDSWGRPIQKPSNITALPPEFSKPHAPFADPQLTPEFAKQLILRDFPGVVEVKKVVMARTAGPAWRVGVTSNGGDVIEAMEASGVVQAYFKMDDGTCTAFVDGVFLRKRTLGPGNGFGEVQAESDPLKKNAHYKIPCDWK